MSVAAGDRGGASRGPGGAGRATCRPASRRSTGSIRLMQAMADEGCDVIEVGLPYSDPVMDGPTIQAAAELALVAGHADHRRASASSRRVRPHGADAGDDVLEPGRAVRRRALRRRPRRGRRRRPDHARPDPRRGRDRGSRRPTRTASTRSSWSRRRRPTARLQSTTAACRGFVYATAVMGVTGAREQVSAVAPELVAGYARGHRPADRGRPRRLQRRAGRRGRRVRRRRHRRQRVRACRRRSAATSTRPSRPSRRSTRTSPPECAGNSEPAGYRCNGR